MRRRMAPAAYPTLEVDEQPTAPQGLRLLGLAPGGGCLAAGIAAGAGGLLHHLFTLTAFTEESGGPFLWPDPRDLPARVLPGTVLSGARTFLRHAPAIARPIQQPLSSYRGREPASINHALTMC